MKGTNGALRPSTYALLEKLAKQGIEVWLDIHGDIRVRGKVKRVLKDGTVKRYRVPDEAVKQLKAREYALKCYLRESPGPPPNYAPRPGETVFDAMKRLIREGC